MSSLCIHAEGLRETCTIKINSILQKSLSWNVTDIKHFNSRTNQYNYLHTHTHTYICKGNYLFLPLHFTVWTITLCYNYVDIQVIYVYHAFFTFGLINNTVNFSDYKVSNITRINDKQIETCVERSTHKPTLQHLLPPPTKWQQPFTTIQKDCISGLKKDFGIHTVCDREQQFCGTTVVRTYL